MNRISVEEYAAIVAAHLAVVLERPSSAVPLASALGRVLDEPVVGPIDLPPFRNSQMDGYAVRAADTTSAPVVLAVGGVVAAGTAPPPLPFGGALKVMTGAPMPDGADAVVPVEAVHLLEDGIRIGAAVAVGSYVRDRGSDLARGSLLLPAGIRLAPRHLAALAAAGVQRVPVRDPLRVGIISTGRELVAPGKPLEPGELPDANGTALEAAARADGANAVFVGRVGDDPAELALSIRAAREAGAEVVVTSGGISMGDFEPVRALLAEVGGTVGTVDMQPGGPQAYGVVEQVPLVAFPGNPVSALLSFALFLSPLLRDAAGLPPARRERMRLAVDVDLPSGRRRFLRARRTALGEVEPVGGTGSHLIAAMAAADLLIDVRGDSGALVAGSFVDTVEL